MMNWSAAAKANFDISFRSNFDSTTSCQRMLSLEGSALLSRVTLFLLDLRRAESSPKLIYIKHMPEKTTFRTLWLYWEVSDNLRINKIYV